MCFTARRYGVGRLMRIHGVAAQRCAAIASAGVGGEFPIKRQSGSETDRGNAASKRDDQARQE
jgi:hypothetical protein